MTSDIASFGKAKSVGSVAQLKAHYNVGPCATVSEYTSSADTAEYEATQQTSHSWASAYQTPLPNTPRVGSETLRLDHK
ncbi:hypothetical protein TNCV_2774711 [Trichonephila clavipes]|nr:hypothetical protein TNCV_2774711 [Trichonephila clavipes]